LSLKEEAQEHRKRCSKCGVEKPYSEYYKKGARKEAKCRGCLKVLRANEYRRKWNLPALSKCKITKVIVKQVKPENLEQFRREMETVELILENLIYKVLSRKIAKVS
jgi:hypothetical protein